MISNEELDELLLGCYNRAAASAWKHAGAVFHCLYHHGFRINELKGINSWHITTKGLIIAKTSKSNVWREIPAEDMHALVSHSIEEGINHVFTHSYRTYDRYFQQKIGYKLTVQSKVITTHLFRHNLIKKLASQGHSDEAIKYRMGLRTQQTLESYKNSVITAHYLN